MVCVRTCVYSVLCFLALVFCLSFAGLACTAVSARSRELIKRKTANLLLQIVIHRSAELLDARNQGPSLIELLVHVLDRTLQHQSLAPPLTFEAWHQLGESVETLPDRLTALLL